MYGFTTVGVLCVFMDLLLGYFVLMKEFSLFSAEPLCSARQWKEKDWEKHKKYEKEEAEILWNCIKISILVLLRLPDSGSKIIFKYL